MHDIPSEIMKCKKYIACDKFSLAFHNHTLYTKISTNAMINKGDRMLLLEDDLIAERIKHFRESANLTQEKLGERINISPTHISTVENGGSYSLNTLITICDGLNTRLDYVLYGNIRDNGKDNLIDLLNLCTNKDIAILEAVAHTLIENKEK